MNDKIRIEEKMVFGVVPNVQGAPMVMIGIPRQAWEYMRDGKTHTLDLTKAGVPVKFMLFGGADHSECMRFIEDAAQTAGVPLLDQRRKDFSIK